MADTLLWIGGWASGLACWEGEFAALYPGKKHRFLDAHDVLADRTVLPEAMSALPEDGVVLAWSLGSLLLHRALVEGALPRRRAVSLCPIFDFCGPGSPWPPAVLRRMVRRLSPSPVGVLSEFWSLVRGNTPVSLAAEASWKRQAEGYSIESLAAGLEALGGLKADPAVMPAGPQRPLFVASPADTLAPAGADRSASLLRDGAWTLFPGGHLPFLEYPGIIRPFLEAHP